MPQRCLGLEDPAGGAPRPCIFAADGRGGPGEVKRRRDGARRAFCCPEAFDRAVNSRVGMGHMTKRLKGWFEDGSRSYEAAFTFGTPGLLLSGSDQRALRRRAGELPYFNTATSWLHRKAARPFGNLKLNILKPKMATTGKLHLVGAKFSKMTASNFGSNSLCGPSTAFQGTWLNQGGGPQDPPRSYNLWPRQPKMAKTGIMHLLGLKFSKMTTPNFGPNSLCGPSTVFQGRWPKHGGGPQDPPKKRQFVAQAALDHVEAQSGHLEA